VVIGADGGSSDGTPEIVADVTAAATSARIGGLRTRHRIGASYRGLPGRASAIRLIFTATDLLQAQAVAICDADAAGLAPEWIGALLQPITTRSLDIVAGGYLRHPLEALLVTQLIRPLMRAVYGRQFEQPLFSAFGCSRRFAAGCLDQDVWDRSPIREGIEVWLAGTAAGGNYLAGQVSLGRSGSSGRPGGGLQAVFPPLVGALFATIERHAGIWIQSERETPPPIIGLDTSSTAGLEAPALDASSLGATFFRDVRDLQPVLEQILSSETFASLSATAGENADVVRYDDETWVATVYDFAVAHGRGVMDRAHIVQALMPLYLGRAASFLAEHAAAAVTDIEQDLERLSEQFERQRHALIERWPRTT
jgi:hypothetical protein